MRNFIFGFLFAILLIMAAGYGYLALGMAPVATASAPLPFERALAHLALKAGMKDVPKSSPIQASNGAYLAGAKVYQNNCAVCHGLPNQPQTAISKGEFPKPPALFGADDVPDDEVGGTYWKVASGIRLTGMPGFKGSLTDEQIWQVSLLLKHADNLPPNVKTSLATPIDPVPAVAK
jgi:thiosulfate dehydrogenase